MTVVPGVCYVCGQPTVDHRPSELAFGCQRTASVWVNERSVELDEQLADIALARELDDLHDDEQQHEQEVAF